jgi:hypothetical protein
MTNVPISKSHQVQSMQILPEQTVVHTPHSHAKNRQNLANLPGQVAHSLYLAHMSISTSAQYVTLEIKIE